MNNFTHASLPGKLIIAIMIGLFCLPQTVFASVIPEYQRLEPIKKYVSYPTSLALDVYENIYVTESIENRLLIFSQSGSHLKTLAGLSEPLGIAVDQYGRIFVGNKLDRNVEVYDPGLNFLFKLGSGNGEFSQPTSIAINEDRIYVADSLEDNIKVYNPDGSFSFSFGQTGNGAGQFNFPVALAVNDISGELIVLDRQNIESMSGAGQGARVQIFDMEGVFKRSFGERGIGDGKLSKPVGVAVDGKSRIYVTDTYQQLVQVFDENGTFLTSLYNADHQLRTPMGIVRGDSNRLYIASLHTGSVEVYGIDAYTQLSVAPLLLYFEGDGKGTDTASQFVEIGNEGNSPLTWSAYSEHSWITLTEYSGSLDPLETHIIEIGVNMNGLSEGIHTGTVQLVAESGATEIVEVVFSVVHPPTPELSVHPLSLEFVSVNGSSPASQSLSISNDGTGVLTWSATSDSDWISMDKIAGTAPDDIPVSVNVSGLNEGTFTGSVSIMGQGALSSPLSILVQLEVREERGTISVTTNIDSATFVISGPESYSGSGPAWDVKNAPAGTYYIQFNGVNGHISPSHKNQTLIADGKIIFHGEYIKTEEELNEEERSLQIITGAGPGEANNGSVKVFDPYGKESGIAFQAYGYPYGVNVAAGDMNNDGIDEIITAPGPGPDNPAEVRIFDNTGSQLHHLTTTVLPHFYGANIATGDLNCDGYDEIIVGAGSFTGNPMEVRVYVHDPEQGMLVDSGINLNAFESTGGVLVAAGDMDGDQYEEIITAPANVFGENIKIRTWKVDRSAGAGKWSVSLAEEFSIKRRKHSKFSLRTRNIQSISMTVSDINGDGIDEIITGSRSNSGGAGIIHIFDAVGGEISEFQAGDRQHYISSVASADMDGDGAAEIIAGTVHRTLLTTEITIFDAFGSEKTTFTEPETQHGVTLAIGSLF
ncbi:MAG: VCBS repeat-containing protein [Nitrospiraceae bacterium]|nr:MAG: VCBS repeat-containing protein [Nitrospiraceae bacterium]